MAGHPRRSRGWLALGITAVLVATLFNPLSAFADTDLVIGGQARISYANGDDVRLREEPDFSGTLIRFVPEGTILDVVDGPFTDDEGSIWYQLSYDGDTGYIVSDYLALDDSSAPTTQNGSPGTVIGSALIAGTNNDGVRCRTTASVDGAVVTVVSEGALVDLIGAADGGWQPINCGGVAGYVSTDFVSYDFSGSSSFGTEAATGEASVSGTNGDGVRCRTSASASSTIITVVAEGSILSLRGDAEGGWQPVICAGSNGYVSSEFVGGGDGATDELAVGADTTGTTYTVSGTNGDGVRCRSRASLEGSIITVLSEGTTVTGRGNQSGDFIPVTCGGTNGWAAAQYLTAGGNGGGGGDGTGSATVTGTGGGLRCRAEAGYNGTVLTVLSDGTSVELNGNVSGDWQPVVCAGQNGFVFSGYLDYDGGGGDGDDDDGGGGGSNSDLESGDAAVVSGTNGDGVRLRSSASFNGAVVMVVSEGSGVKVISGSTGDWVAVSYSGTSGFIHMDFLKAGSGDDDDDDGNRSAGDLEVGDHAKVLSDLNLRYDPSMSGGVAAVAPGGTVVEVTGGVSNGFYAVDWDGLSGYMHGDYLSWTDADLTDRGGSGDDDKDDDGGNDDGDDGDDGGSGTGNAIVDYAMNYLGYPYVWATHGPSSFDCSGFTYWVILNTLGVNISPGTSAQINQGRAISRNALQPGDLVFFQNTYTWGLSHVGIYIGGGKFIHAQNEATGVVISELSSSYYSSRWYGARRIG